MMKNLIKIYALILLIAVTGCAPQTMYNTAEFRHRDIEPHTIALDKGGLSLEQINVITSTKPPKSFPIDVSIIVLKNGYVSSEVENIFTFEVINELKKFDKIKRITIIPSFLVPNQISFNAIQELGVRSLSEYVLVFYINGSEIFNWTKIYESQYEIHSSINFILVDSFTSAMMTSDKLFSKKVYESKLFGLKEERIAKEMLFSEQAKVLAQKIETLFSISNN